MVAAVPHRDQDADGAPFAAEVLVRFERFANPETGWAVLELSLIHI